MSCPVAQPTTESAAGGDLILAKHSRDWQMLHLLRLPAIRHRDERPVSRARARPTHEGFARHLVQGGYAVKVARRHIRGAEHLIDWVDRRHLPIERVDDATLGRSCPSRHPHTTSSGGGRLRRGAREDEAKRWSPRIVFCASTAA